MKQPYYRKGDYLPGRTTLPVSEWQKQCKRYHLDDPDGLSTLAELAVIILGIQTQPDQGYRVVAVDPSTRKVTLRPVLFFSKKDAVELNGTEIWDVQRLAEVFPWLWFADSAKENEQIILALVAFSRDLLGAGTAGITHEVGEAVLRKVGARQIRRLTRNAFVRLCGFRLARLLLRFAKSVVGQCLASFFKTFAVQLTSNYLQQLKEFHLKQQLGAKVTGTPLEAALKKATEAAVVALVSRLIGSVFDKKLSTDIEELETVLEQLESPNKHLKLRMRLEKQLVRDMLVKLYAPATFKVLVEAAAKAATGEFEAGFYAGFKETLRALTIELFQTCKEKILEPGE
jgi:hypothetical protein